MQTITIEDIRKLNPCYDPAIKMPSDWSGTVVDLMNVTGVTSWDKIFIALFFLDAQTISSLADYCVAANPSAEMLIRRAAAGDKIRYYRIVATGAGLKTSADQLEIFSSKCIAYLVGLLS